MRASRALAASAVFALVATLLPSGLDASAGAGPLTVSGTVETAGSPLASYDVTLFATGPAGVNELGSDTTDAGGAFEIPYTAPADAAAVLFLTAAGPAGVTLVNVLGVAPAPGSVVINELTTVAGAYGMAQFTDGTAISGQSPGLQNAAGMVHNLADPVTGAVASVLASKPNGPTTPTADTFNSLGNLLAACVDAAANCTTLFTAATSPAGEVPTNTFAALASVARNAWFNPDALYAQSILAPAPYQPALTAAPQNWALALRFVGDGVSMDGPGNFAVDHRGNVWVTNNYEFSKDPSDNVCGAQNLLRFTPTGEYSPGSPYTGGGLNGAGYGIFDIDPFGDVWVGNFGFASPGCPADRQPKHNSVSQFSGDGVAISPGATSTSGGGWTQGGVSWPQGAVSDAAGNIWIANCGNDSVTIYPDGDPNRATQVRNTGIGKPFDIAFNLQGQAFVTGNGSDSVLMLNPDGSPAAPPITGFDRPLGVIADSQGNIWVSSSAFVSVPCPDATPKPPGGGGYLTLLNPDGTVAASTPRQAGGMTIAWGNTVDGADNVWVANFNGNRNKQRLSQFCGVPAEGCPPGVGTAEPIAPDGYEFDGFTRNTGVAVDPSGNVWVANNWKRVPVQSNPGGYQVVVFVGLAPPVTIDPPIPRPPRPVPVGPTFTG